MSSIDVLVRHWEGDMLAEPSPAHLFGHTKVDTGHWQGLKNVPHTQTRERQYVSFTYQIPTTVEVLDKEVKPNQPWAENHFQERVSGEPLNPGKEYKNWPWYRGGVEDHLKQHDFEPDMNEYQQPVNRAPRQFSHTYMERYWPKNANLEDGLKFMLHRGVRYNYGDLQDVVNLLASEPTTRQAYLPVWFPEDTGAAGEPRQRVPCSLGYHFMMRDGVLNCMYHMRSCDLIRYFRDDVYLTCRLVQWVLQELQNRKESLGHPDWVWDDVHPGTLHMMIASLHIFEGDIPMLRRKYGNN